MMEPETYSCIRCHGVDSFNRKQMFDHNKEFHRTKKRFECDLCLNRMDSTSQLETHKRTHGGGQPALDPIICITCNGRTFETKDKLVEHNEVVHTHFKFKCYNCANWFKWFDRLRQHVCGTLLQIND